MVRSVIGYAKDIAFHAGWYVHCGVSDRLIIGVRGKSVYGPRGMRWFHLDFVLWTDVYIIDGSTCRKKRLVMLARLPNDEWLLVIETRKLVCEEGLVHGKPRCCVDWVKVAEEVITKEQALDILASYWDGALIHKLWLYPHYQALKEALKGD